jgi:hypothetical protein
MGYFSISCSLNLQETAKLRNPSAVSTVFLILNVFTAVQRITTPLYVLLKEYPSIQAVSMK